MSQTNKHIFHVRRILTRTKIRVAVWHVYIVHISQRGYTTSTAIKLRQLCLFGFCQRIYCSLNVRQSAQTHWLRGFYRKRHCICAVTNSIIKNNTNNYTNRGEEKNLSIHRYIVWKIKFAIQNVKYDFCCHKLFHALFFPDKFRDSKVKKNIHVERLKKKSDASINLVGRVRLRMRNCLCK